MNKTTTVNPSNAQKGELPDAWGKIKAMESKPMHSPYNRYSPEGIRAEREELKEKMRLFWSERTDFPHKLDLFAPGYDWSEYCAYAGLELKAGRDRETREYYPSEMMMRMFVLLSEQEFDGACSERLRDTFSQIKWDDAGFWTEYSGAALGQAGLVQIISPIALARLMRSIDGGDIANLLMGSATSDECKQRHGQERLVEKILDSLPGWHTDSAERLMKHVALNPGAARIIHILRKVGNEKADLAAKYLTNFLEEVSRWTQQALESLKGG